MSLSIQLSNFNDSITETITSLLKTIAVHSDNSPEKMIDLRAFSLDTAHVSPYHLEILADGYKVEYITSSKAYCERGMQYDLSTVTDAHLSDLCDALDVLTEKGYPSYDVVLRATVHVDLNDLGEDFTFPSEWEQYDRTGDEDLVIRLDTIMQVNASTKDDAIKVAKENPVSLGLDGISCTVDHWVDEDQSDDVQLVTQ